ncbi:MAG TPA: methylmalonyl-CoA mutase family protein, partial [Candidatus Eremiobacteraceae bacterium]|nr:methylmalonyl-CoA mutase family protein [Candidatus Eremiobacteraceae bacterium]
EAMAAVLGGTQSLHTNSMDEVLALPSEKAAEIALRTQQVLAYETNVGNVADPLGGSYFVERLTAELQTAAQALMQDIERRGGAVAVIENGWMQEQIAESAYRAQRAVEEGQNVVVGVNKFVDPSAASQQPQLQRIDPVLEQEQRDRVAAARARRDATQAAQRLAAVRRAAESGTPLLPEFLEAVDAGCTLGEVCDALRAVFSVYHPAAAL